MIENEGDVREAVRGAFGRDRAIRIEQASGSTFGVPDILLPMPVELPNGVIRSALFPLELKVGELKGSKITYSLRPSQVKFLRLMEMLHCPVAVVVGRKEADELFVVRNSERTRGGEIDLDWFDGDPFLGCCASDRGAVKSNIRTMWEYMTGAFPADISFK